MFYKSLSTFKRYPDFICGIPFLLNVLSMKYTIGENEGLQMQMVYAKLVKYSLIQVERRE